MELNQKYKSNYPSEVIYKSDKNFNVRLKAFLERNMKEIGYKTSGEKFNELIGRLNNSEEYFFESITSVKQEEDQEEMWNEAAETLFKHHNPDLDINSVAGQVTLNGFYKDTNRLKSKYIIHSKK